MWCFILDRKVAHSEFRKSDLQSEKITMIKNALYGRLELRNNNFKRVKTYLRNCNIVIFKADDANAWKLLFSEFRNKPLTLCVVILIQIISTFLRKQRVCYESVYKGKKCCQLPLSSTFDK